MQRYDRNVKSIASRILRELAKLKFESTSDVQSMVISVWTIILLNTVVDWTSKSSSTF